MPSKYNALSYSDSDEEEEERWCICNSTDTSRFMIGCDRCSSWFHGDCVNISEKQAASIKHYYCKSCQRKCGNLSIVYEKKPQPKKGPSKCGNCSGCRMTKDCGKCRNCRHSDRPFMCELRRCLKPITHPHPKPSLQRDLKSPISSSSNSDSDASYKYPTKKQEIHQKRKKKAFFLSSDDEDSAKLSSDGEISSDIDNFRIDATKKKPKATKEHVKKTPTRGSQYSTNKSMTKKSSQTSMSKSKSNKLKKVREKTPEQQRAYQEIPIPSFFSENPVRQCLGLGCVNPVTSMQTKYCSKKCGLKLALKRLEVLLPESLNQSAEKDAFNYSNNNIEIKQSFADKMDDKRLKEVHQDQIHINKQLIRLEEEHSKLTALINRSRSQKPIEAEMAAALKADLLETEQLDPVVCVVCASEVNVRVALKHFDKCFQKMEGSTVFCASQKEQIMGTPLFCDYFDPQAKAYCKRLKVVCEHFKEVKLPNDCPCGFPLVETSKSEFCVTPRQKCTKHYGWERRKRATIDIERYRMLIKMDELLQEEHRIKKNKLQRSGLLGLLLHKITDHKPHEPIIPQINANK